MCVCVMHHFQIQIFCNPIAICASGTWVNKSKNFQNNCKQMKQRQITIESNEGLNQPTMTMLLYYGYDDDVEGNE